MDPGWKPALIPLMRRMLMPWTRARFDRPQPGGDGLIIFRVIWLSLVVALYLFLIPLGFIVPWSGDAGWRALVVTFIGVFSVVLVARIRTWKIDATDETSLRTSYTRIFYVGFAVAEGAAMIAFIAVFLTNTLWVYLIGVAFATVGMVLISPSKSNLAYHQRRLRERGSALSLVEALRSTSS